MVSAARVHPLPEREDGRTERTRRTRAAIVQAHMDLMTEGDLRPSAQRIAERGGVSVRTLWIHFADMEALLTATAEAVFRAHERSHHPIPAALPLAERIDRFCRQRARLLEEIALYATASQMREPISPALQRYRARHVRRVAEEIEDLFADELATSAAERRDQVHALTAAASWGSWSTYREHFGMGVPRSRRAMTRTVAALLAQPPDSSTPPPCTEEPT